MVKKRLIRQFLLEKNRQRDKKCLKQDNDLHKKLIKQKMTENSMTDTESNETP